MGVSFVSVENARLNLEAEQQERSFDDIRAAARRSWNDDLGRIAYCRPDGSCQLRTDDSWWLDVYRSSRHCAWHFQHPPECRTIETRNSTRPRFAGTLIYFFAERFLYQFNDLWTTLSRLEYIGKHKENIVVAERSRQPKETNESRWNILD